MCPLRSTFSRAPQMTTMSPSDWIWRDLREKQSRPVDGHLRSIQGHVNTAVQLRAKRKVKPKSQRMQHALRAQRTENSLGCDPQARSHSTVSITPQSMFVVTSSHKSWLSQLCTVNKVSCALTPVHGHMSGLHESGAQANAGHEFL